MSRTGDFTDFTPTYDDGEVVGDHAITVTIADDEVQDIRWMVSPPPRLLVGTAQRRVPAGAGEHRTSRWRATTCGRAAERSTARLAERAGRTHRRRRAVRAEGRAETA